MSERGQPGDFSLRLPRPGRALKLVLGIVLAGAIAGSAFGEPVYAYLALSPDDFRHISATHIPHVWALLTSGFLTEPNLSHPILSLLGLYFLTTDLERRWGGPRLMRFLALSIILGNLFVLAGTFLPFASFKPALVVGPLAAISATAVAWAKDNLANRAKFMALIPMTGRTFLYLAIGAAVLMLFSPGTAEGVAAPLGGVVAGLLFAGSPSPARTLWLKLRLGSMRRRGGTGITVSDLLEGSDIDTSRSRPTAKRPAGKVPPLRIVQGGLDDDLKNRKPPKDKRYLN